MVQEADLLKVKNTYIFWLGCKLCGAAVGALGVQLWLETGFEASIHLAWMGTVRREGLNKGALLSERLDLHHKNWTFACQPGWLSEGTAEVLLVSDALQIQKQEILTNLKTNKMLQRFSWVVLKTYKNDEVEIHNCTHFNEDMSFWKYFFHLCICILCL